MLLFCCALRARFQPELSAFKLNFIPFLCIFLSAYSDHPIHPLFILGVYQINEGVCGGGVSTDMPYSDLDLIP